MLRDRLGERLGNPLGHRRRGRHSLGALLIVLAITAAACGSIAEKATEELIEQAIESEDGTNVELDLDTEDGGFTIESDEGSIQVGSGLDLPDGLEVPVPTGGNVTTAQTAEGYVQASVTFPQDRYEEIVEFYDDWASSQGGDIQTSNSQYTSDDGVLRNHNWSDGEAGISIGLADCFSLDGDGMDACVTVINT